MRSRLSYLGRLREAAGLDIGTAAQRLDISPGRLRAIEDRRVEPWFNEMLHIARLYGADLSEITRWWFENPPPRESAPDRTPGHGEDDG
jgi:transcriptional regulator with XRE-family HTH domain